MASDTLSVLSMSSWQELAAEKKRRQTASIPKEWLITRPADDVLDVTGVPTSCGLLSARELKITAVSELATLLKKLATGEWSSVEVTTAFCKRAIVAHQLVCPSSRLPIKWQPYLSYVTCQTNCLTEIFIDRALERAAWLDEQLKSTGKVVGPLHGLPVSLKDQIRIKGLETVMGACALYPFGIVGNTFERLRIRLVDR
jgi:amidase